MRIDSGGEFCENEFNKLYKQHSIDRSNTTPYTAQQNKVHEKMNRTLMEKARSMLSDVDLSQDYCEEAVKTTCYVVNKSPMMTLVDKTPYEAWASKRPSLTHLRVFRCDPFLHIPKEGRQKLVSWRSISLSDTRMV